MRDNKGDFAYPIGVLLFFIVQHIASFRSMAYAIYVTAPHVPTGKRKEKAPIKDAASLPCSASGQNVSRLIGTILIMLLGLFHAVHIENIMEFTNHAAYVLRGKPTVFHGVDDIAPASAGAPRLG
jgi:hypothetical protein